MRFSVVLRVLCNACGLLVALGASETEATPPPMYPPPPPVYPPPVPARSRGNLSPVPVERDSIAIIVASVCTPVFVVGLFLACVFGHYLKGRKCAKVVPASEA